MSYLVGCDPEVFVFNDETGKFVNAHGMIPGTKVEPFKVKQGAVQVDGMALEFNIDPAATSEEFIDNIVTVYQQLQGMIPKGHRLVAVPTAHFDQEVFDNSPPEALELGCEPDYNAYNGRENPRPNAQGRMFRTASGHVHIGWTSGVEVTDRGHIEDCRVVVKQLDHALGWQATRFDLDNERRLLYGKAGAFRPKSYGVEYRTLSNQWIRTRQHMKWVFDTTQQALNLLEQETYFPNLYHWPNAPDAINQGRRGTPADFEYMTNQGIPLVPLMNARALRTAVA